MRPVSKEAITLIHQSPLLTIPTDQESGSRRLIIQGSRPLSGQVRASGSKNSGLALVAASLLAASGRVKLTNLSSCSDIDAMLAILTALGAQVDRGQEGQVSIDTRTLSDVETPYAVASRIRGSIYFLGALLARTGQARVAYPGGCQIGSRPVDYHIRGLEALGAHVVLDHGWMLATAPHGLVGTRIYVDRASVGTTANLMMAATLAEGTTILDNAAMEPEIVDLATFLTSMGARVRGAGTPTVRIEGVTELTGACHEVIPDRIEAGSYLLAGVVTRGRVTVTRTIPAHLHAVLGKLRDMGADIQASEPDYAVTAEMDRPIRPVDLESAPYPGFPTDLQPQMSIALALAPGTSVVRETIWDSRFAYTQDLARMGARIRVEADTAIVSGVDALGGAPVIARDLRGGMALVLAGLAADGVTEVAGTAHIERGYTGLVSKLSGLGALIRYA